MDGGPTKCVTFYRSSTISSLTGRCHPRHAMASTHIIATKRSIRYKRTRVAHCGINGDVKADTAASTVHEQYHSPGKVLQFSCIQLGMQPPTWPDASLHILWTHAANSRCTWTPSGMLARMRLSVPYTHHFPFQLKQTTLPVGTHSNVCENLQHLMCTIECKKRLWDCRFMWTFK